MDTEFEFVPNYCPNCGTEVGEDNSCENCKRSMVFTADEFNSLEIKYCRSCGTLLDPNSDTCHECGKETRITQATIHIQRGSDLFHEGRKAEAVIEAKKALILENDPGGRFMICGVIVATQGDLLKEKYLDKYAELNYFPKEVIESTEFQDILKYGKQALDELDKCTPDIRRQIESNPNNNVEGIKHTVKEFSDAINNPNPAAQLRASEKTGGCFIATACYGSDNAPEVLTLRAFRDKFLLISKKGRVLVHIYYSISPPFAKVIASNNLLRSVVRKYFIRPIVSICRSKLP